MTWRRAESGALLLAVFAGASWWITSGVLTVNSELVVRIGALPGVERLALGVIVALTAVWLLRLRTSEAWPLTLLALVWLPWLPLALPAPLLIWEGPLEFVVWCAAIGGVAVQRLRRPRASIWSDPARAPWLLAGVLLCCSLASAWALRPILPAGDEPHYLVIAQSLLSDGDLKIENNHRRGDFLAYIDRDLPPHYLRRGKDGEIYSIHAPGTAVVVLPAFAIAGYPGALVTVALIAALTVVLMWRTAHTVTGDVGAAWAATVMVAASATFFLHSFTIFPDPIGALPIAWLVFVLGRWHMTPEAVTRIDFVLLGVALALLPWLHTRFALLAAAAGLVIVSRLIAARSWEWMVAFAATPVVSAMAWFAYFWVIYGTPNPAAPYGNSQQTAWEWIAAGFAGLAFDQQFGLFANAPALVLAAIGFVWFAHDHPRLAGQFAVIGVPYVLAVAAFGMWWGGWSAPARFLTAVLPLAIVPLAYAWFHGGMAVRAATLALSGLGAVNVAARVTLESGALVYNLRDGFDVLLDWANRSVNLPLALPSVHRLGVESTWIAGMVWVLAALIGMLALDTVLPRARTLAARWTATIAVLLLTAMAAMEATAAVTRVRLVTTETSEAHFVQRWDPSAQPVSVRIVPPRVTVIASPLEHIELRTPTRGRMSPPQGALFAMPRLPAGDYRVQVDATEPIGELTLSIGHTTIAADRWRLGPNAPARRMHFSAPALLHSVTIRGDAAALRTVRSVSLRPERLKRRSADARRFVWRGARYGAIRAFSLDGLLFMEPAGVWTVGDETAEMIVTRRRRKDVPVTIGAGPVRTSVGITVGETTRTVDLEPGERREITLPAGRWTIDTKGMFRPVDYGPNNKDARPLGARLEFQ